jgi:ribosomal protein S18 acetylase RimI-like enzyme
MKSQETEQITTRPVQREDEPFLLALYISTREAELGAVGWDAEQIGLFCQMQFMAQRRQYALSYPKGDDRIILNDKNAIGHIIVDRDKEICLVDLALVPEYRGKGIGTSLLQQLISEAVAAGKLLRLHVLSNNPAIRLYERLGFLLVGNNGIYWEMVRSPDLNQTVSAVVS